MKIQGKSVANMRNLGNIAEGRRLRGGGVAPAGGALDGVVAALQAPALQDQRYLRPLQMYARGIMLTADAIREYWDLKDGVEAESEAESDGDRFSEMED